MERTRRTWITGVGNNCVLSVRGALQLEFVMIYTIYHTENATLHFKSELRFQEL